MSDYKDLAVQEVALEIIGRLRVEVSVDPDIRIWGVLYRIGEAIRGYPFSPWVVPYGAWNVGASYLLLPSNVVEQHLQQTADAVDKILGEGRR